MIAGKRILLNCVAAFFAMGAWTGAGSAAECQGGLSERVLDLSESEIASFGTLGKFKSLPLAAGEYVLTFDDGPRIQTTPKILDELRAACLHATFFMMGKNAIRRPLLARMVLAAGHSIGSHTYSHKVLNTLPYDDAVNEIKRGVKAVETAVFGNRITPVTLFRFPDNVSTPELVEAASRLGLIIASYDVSPEDWRNSPPEESLKRLRQRLNTVDRGVIVMHDVQENTVPLLPMVLAELKARGASIVHLVE